jgi:hypothetical protein
LDTYFGRFNGDNLKRVEKSASYRSFASGFLFAQELRGDPKFVDALDKAANVMAQHLTIDFIRHRNLGLAAHMIPELGFDHIESGFDVGAPRTASTQEVMVHYISGKGPQAAAGPGRRALTGVILNTRRVSYAKHHFSVGRPAGHSRKSLRDVH